jgi:hypothetical protein
MAEEVGVVLTAVSTTTSVLRAIDSLIRGTRGRKRALLLELRHNIGVINLYTEGNSPIDSVITKIETEQLKAALESNFDFGSLKRSRVRKRTAGNTPQYKRYIGWTTEKLYSNIYLRIKELKTIVEIDTYNKRYRKSVRLLNIRKLMILLLKHIRS